MSDRAYPHVLFMCCEPLVAVPFGTQEGVTHAQAPANSDLAQPSCLWCTGCTNLAHTPLVDIFFCAPVGHLNSLFNSHL